jgi:hypothetical protein
MREQRTEMQVKPRPSGVFAFLGSAFFEFRAFAGIRVREAKPAAAPELSYRKVWADGRAKRVRRTFLQESFAIRRCNTEGNNMPLTE